MSGWNVSAVAHRAIVMTVVGLQLLTADVSFAEAESSYAGFLESDTRFTLRGKKATDGDPRDRLLRLENTAGASAYYGSSDAGAMFEGRFIFYGGTEVTTFTDLSDRRVVDPYRFESNALYVEFNDIAVEGLDLRIGRQIVEWGSADQFNPTSVVNPLDLEDPIKFGDRVANEMVSLTWNAPWLIEGENGLIFDEFTVSLVVVPAFRSQLIPDFAYNAFTEPALMKALVPSEDLGKMAELNTQFAQNGGLLAYDIRVENPDLSVDNFQYGAHMSANVLGISLGLSYYRGFSDIPYATYVGPQLPPELDAASRQLGSIDFREAETLSSMMTQVAGQTVTTHINLAYPEIQMFGGQLSTSLDFIGGLGLWAEAAFVTHGDQDLELNAGYQPERDADGNTIIVDRIVHDTTVKEGNFLKVAAGMDYSITSWWYINVQYLHGFVDEFGTENLNDYVVANMDLKFFNDALLWRTAVLHQFADKSTVIFPNLVGTFWEGAELALGAFYCIGDETSKFGASTAGPNFVFVKGRYSF